MVVIYDKSARSASPVHPRTIATNGAPVALHEQQAALSWRRAAKKWRREAKNERETVASVCAALENHHDRAEWFLGRLRRAVGWAWQLRHMLRQAKKGKNMSGEIINHVPATAKCHGEGRCTAMRIAAQITDDLAMRRLSPSSDNAKLGLAFTMAAVQTGECPRCRRPIR